MDEHKHCEFCKYFAHAHYQCRRHAPIKERERWPAVFPHDWCGDFEERQMTDNDYRKVLMNKEKE